MIHLKKFSNCQERSTSHISGLLTLSYLSILKVSNHITLSRLQLNSNSMLCTSVFLLVMVTTINLILFGSFQKCKLSYRVIVCSLTNNFCGRNGIFKKHLTSVIRLPTYTSTVDNYFLWIDLYCLWYIMGLCCSICYDSENNWISSKVLFATGRNKLCYSFYLSHYKVAKTSLQRL